MPRHAHGYLSYPKVGLRKPQIQFADHGEDATNATTYTFTSKKLGDQRGDRFILCGLGSCDSAVKFSSGTAGGVSLSKIVEVATNWQACLAISSIPVTDTVTGSIAVTWGAAGTHAGCAVLPLYGCRTPLIPVQTQSTDANLATTLSVTLWVPPGGIGVAYACSTGLSVPYTWSQPFVAAFSATLGGEDASHGAAYTTNAGILTVTCNFNSNNDHCALVAASWGP